MFEAVRAYFRGEEIQKSKWGGGKDLEEFELYLPVHTTSPTKGLELKGNHGGLGPIFFPTLP